jgi:hypothetical protein
MPRPSIRPAWVALYKTAAWRERAAAQLQAEPWCRFHAQRGERVKATTADHIERHRGDPHLFMAGALQSLCAHCHSSVKQSLERGSRAGCGPDGLPTDKTHPWSS